MDGKPDRNPPERPSMMANSGWSDSKLSTDFPPGRKPPEQPCMMIGTGCSDIVLSDLLAVAGLCVCVVLAALLIVAIEPRGLPTDEGFCRIGGM